MNITLNNYEKYFLLLADNELNPAEETQVWQFAAQHPHLHEELELLFSCRLDAADMPFFPKEKLLRPAVWDIENPPPVHTQMLSLLDDELPIAEKEQLKKQIAASPVLNAEWNILQKTVLPTEAIAYPDKTELYRQQKVRPLVWVRWAAAAAVIAFVWVLWPVGNKISTSANAVAALPKLNVVIAIPVQLNEQSSKETSYVQPPNNTAADATPTQQKLKEAIQKQPENTQVLLVANSKKKNTATSKNEKVILKKEPIVPEQETLASVEPESLTLGKNNFITATLSEPEDISVQTAGISPKINSLAIDPVQNTLAVNTDAVDENESYIHIAGARIDKHKMRGLFRGFTRSVARTFSKSKIQPEVVAYNPKKS